MTIDLTREEDVDWFSELRSTVKQEGNDLSENEAREKLQEANREDIVDAIDDVFGKDVAEELDEYTVGKDDLLQEIQEVVTPEELADIASAVSKDVK